MPKAWGRVVAMSDPWRAKQRLQTLASREVDNKMWELMWRTWGPVMASLLGALMECPNFEGRFYRGIPCDVSNLYLQGTRVSFSGLTSTSTEVRTAVTCSLTDDGTPGTVLRINMFSGRRLGELSCFPKEEVRGCRHTPSSVVSKPQLAVRKEIGVEVCVWESKLVQLRGDTVYW